MKIGPQSQAQMDDKASMVMVMEQKCGVLKGLPTAMGHLSSFPENQRLYLRYDS